MPRLGHECHTDFDALGRSLAPASHKKVRPGAASGFLRSGQYTVHDSCKWIRMADLSLVLGMFAVHISCIADQGVFSAQLAASHIYVGKGDRVKYLESRWASPLCLRSYVYVAVRISEILLIGLAGFLRTPPTGHTLDTKLPELPGSSQRCSSSNPVPLGHEIRVGCGLWSSDLSPSRAALPSADFLSRPVYF